MHRPIWQLELGFHPSHQLPICWNRLKKKVGKRFIEKVSGGHSLRLPLKDTFDRDLVLEIDDVENRISLPYNTRIISPRSLYIILLSFQNCDIFYTIFFIVGVEESRTVDTGDSENLRRYREHQNEHVYCQRETKE